MNRNPSQAFAFLLLVSWCSALVTVRVAVTGSMMYAFLVWNLGLAVVPLGLASLLEGCRPGERLKPGLVLASWLVFLPNAPYLATDLVHLVERPPVPLWYDVAMLSSCAGTGLLLGYASLMRVQRWIAKMVGATSGWLFSVATLLLAGLGIYLGRFLRWNSWDLLLNPIEVLRDIAAAASRPHAHGTALGVSAIWGVGLLIGYVATVAVTAPSSGLTEP